MPNLDLLEIKAELRKKLSAEIDQREEELLADIDCNGMLTERMAAVKAIAKIRTGVDTILDSTIHNKVGT